MTSKSIILSMLSGILMVFAFPPFDVWIITWFSMMPLFFAIYDKKPMQAFALGFIWGVVFFIGTVYWVVNSMVNYGGVSVFASIMILLLLVIVLSLYFAVFSCFAFSLQPPALSLRGHALAFSLFFIPSFWVSLEYVRTYLFTGFPWVLLGYSQTSFLPIMQIADITGVYGVSFLVVVVNVFLFNMIKSFYSQPFKGGIIVFSVISIAISYGYFRIIQIDRLAKDWKQIGIGIAQGNIEQAVKWVPEYQEDTINIYRDLSMEIINKSQISNLKSQKMDLIVWPETAVPFYLQSDERLAPLVFDIARALSVGIAAGSPAYGYGNDGKTLNYYNSVFLLSKQGNIIDRYDKVHLVPFGEYVPFKRFLPFEKIVAGVGDFSSGSGLKPIALNNGGFGALICFEVIFPHIAREFVKNGADFLINVTNDAWFGKSSAPYQHLSQSLVRAIENRVYLVRSANTGISAIIDPVGRLKAKSGLFTREVLIDTIYLKERTFTTFYTRYGNVFAVLCVVVSITGLLCRFIKTH